MIKLSETILNLRKQRGMTQDELAEALQVSRQTIYKWETGRALPDVNRLKQICELFHVSADALLELCPPVNRKPETPAGDTQERSNSAAIPAKHWKKHALCAGAAVVLLCVCIVMLLTRQPEELRQARQLGIVPSEMTGGRSQFVSEWALLTLLSGVCEKENGAVPAALAACAEHATNEQMTREKAAYWLYCAHIWIKCDPDADLSIETDVSLLSLRSVYEDLNVQSRLNVDGMGVRWERSLCNELAEVDTLFGEYDGTTEMNEKINAILYGPYDTSVTFCLAQRSFLSEKPLMDCEGDRFRPKDKITREEAIIAAYRLYGSW